MVFKQNEYHKSKFNQYYLTNPSIQNFCKTIHALCLYSSNNTKKTQTNQLEVIQNPCLYYARKDS